MEYHMTLPLKEEDIEKLKKGDFVYLSGTMYTARDAAHRRMIETLDAGKELPFDIKGETVYYAGPAPARPGQVIGSAGPTTSTRMDRYTPRLLDLGMKGMIGKGKRSEEVKKAIVRNRAVYFAAIGGAGALLAQCIERADLIAYADLGTEAIRKLRVCDFPVIVVTDCTGDSIY